MKKLLLPIIAILAIFASHAFGQLSDLDLLEDNDRSIGLSINRAPDPMTDEDVETQSAIVLLPIEFEPLYFQGGAGAYWTRSLIAGTTSSALQWRLQGGPHYKKLGFQFYLEGVQKQGIDYAGFIRLGEFDLGHVIVSGGLGTLVRADEVTTLESGIERTVANAADTKVKGLVLASAEVDTDLFESLRILGTVLPGLDGEHDLTGELQLSYNFGKVSLVGFMKLGWERSEAVRQWTYIVRVPF